MKEPQAEAMLDRPDAKILPFDQLREQWEKKSQTQWLATVRPDGRPHLVPFAPAWVGDRFYFTTGQGTHKGANLLQNPHCAIGVSTQGFDLFIEGEAVLTHDQATIDRLAAHWAENGWPVTPGDGVLEAPYHAPTTGPAPYVVYEVTPTLIVANGTTDETVNQATRYRF